MNNPTIVEYNYTKTTRLDKYRIYNNVVHERYIIDELFVPELHFSINSWQDSEKGKWVCEHSPLIVWGKAPNHEFYVVDKFTIIAYLSQEIYTFFTLKFS